MALPEKELIDLMEALGNASVLHSEAIIGLAGKLQIVADAQKPRRRRLFRK